MKFAADRFLRIAITLPYFFDGESAEIIRLIRSGEVDYVHIRKPGCDTESLRKLLAELPVDVLRKVRLHDGFELAEEFEVGGVHLNSRNPQPPSEWVHLTKSCHSLEEIPVSGCYDYVTLSPIFDSISKSGYKSAFRIDEISDEIRKKNVVALGGVTPDKFSVLEEAGFIGGAMLGSVWKGKI